MTESGIHPFTIDELLEENQLNEQIKIHLGYGRSNGSLELRDSISTIYTNHGF